MCHHIRRCALTLSPCGPHHFTHHPKGLVCFLLHLSSPESQISNLKSRMPAAPPLAGSLLCSVRTFLSWTETQA
jgi:hypothetical protein